jgi:hypothetical protein
LRDELSVPSLNEEENRAKNVNRPTPNQSSDPTLSSVTPPAGQEARPR